MTIPNAASGKPLDGLNVLEFSHTIMGPCAGLLLADLGANVIKIEPAPDGDKTRQLPGFASGFFDTFNRNKRSVALNLKVAEARQIVHDLAKTADIVLDNYGPGTMLKLGCDWPQLQTVNPQLIFLSLKGFLNGPWKNRPALDEVVQFHSGLAYMTGPPGQPLRAGASIVDILGAVFGVTAALAALRERDITGQGQRVSSALFESAAFLMAPHVAGSVITGENVPPMPARKGAWGIYDVFHCRDSQSLFIGVTSDVQWQRFCEVFNLVTFANDSRLHTNAQRTQAREWLMPELRKVVGSLDYRQVLTLCQAADISWAPIGTPENLITNEQLQAPGGLLSVALSASRAGSESNERLELPNSPLEFGETHQRATLHRHPPLVGEHTEEVLLGLGLALSDIQRLRAEQVIA